jgi:hypothetical protein
MIKGRTGKAWGYIFRSISECDAIKNKKEIEMANDDRFNGDEPYNVEAAIAGICIGLPWWDALSVRAIYRGLGPMTELLLKQYADRTHEGDKEEEGEEG